MNIAVNTKTPYEVIISRGALERSGEKLKSAIRGRALIVTDSGVPRSLVDKAQGILKGLNIDCSLFVMPSGEKNKNAATLFAVLNGLAERKFNRGDTVAALGGGVVGDTAGLAAALYMRGINLVQLPTTLLAMVDSSVGGKTAVDLEGGKNLVGAFYQPSLVVADTAALDTLPTLEMQCGLGEIIKCAVLSGGVLYEEAKGLRLIKSGLYREKNGVLSPADIESAIGGCVKLKSEIVARDERESGERMLLNLGHTVGHAIELLENYSLPHGLCVAKGLVKILGLSAPALAAEVEGIFERLGMDTACNYSAKQLVDAIRADKKSTGEGVNVVLAHGAGRPYIRKMTFEELEKRL